jgi:hypothetical protein
MFARNRNGERVIRLWQKPQRNVKVDDCGAQDWPRHQLHADRGRDPCVPHRIKPNLQPPHFPVGLVVSNRNALPQQAPRGVGFPILFIPLDSVALTNRH